MFKSFTVKVNECLADVSIMKLTEFFGAVESEGDICDGGYKKNLVFTELPEIINRAQFLCFDTEFTGLNVEGASNLNYYDTFEELYLKDRLKAETFMAIQFGLVAFFYNNETKTYTHQGFNFYIYPSSYTDVNFTCQSKSIDFLIQHGFDFNKLFKEGIPYLKDEDVERHLKKLDEKLERSGMDNSYKMEIPPLYQSTLDEIFSKIEDILKLKIKSSFTTERHNSYIRRLIYNATQNKFGSEVFLETNKDETMKISVGYSSEEFKEEQKKKYLLKRQEILDEVGFCKVIKLIVESKKLLIGHNLFLDLLFTFRQFLAPLPNTYSEFKELVNFLFPRILDTKHMAYCSSEFRSIKDTSLNSLIEHFENINAIPEVEMVEKGKGYKKEDCKIHEAAYDAYLTGLCFLAMSKCIGSCNFDSKFFETLLESPFLEPIFNKISAPKLCDIFYLNFGGPDKEPDRHGVYHLTFPREWTKENILNLFQNCGNINISWINSVSAYVRVNKEFVSEVENSLIRGNAEYKLCSYKEFNRINQNPADLLLSPLMEKRLGNISKPQIESNGTPKPELSKNTKKRKMDEDIGEVIARPQKKRLSE